MAMILLFLWKMWWYLYEKIWLGLNAIILDDGKELLNLKMLNKLLRLKSIKGYPLKLRATLIVK